MLYFTLLKLFSQIFSLCYNKIMNKNISENPQLKESYDELCRLISETTDEDFLKDFFNCLFTETERSDFARRWLLVKEIHNGTAQREIAKKFNMSLCRITRGSRELHKENSAFLRMLEKV